MVLLGFLCFLVIVIYVDSSKPLHIVFVLVDDLGWNDVGFHGMREIPTPNMDALAADGVILNQYYVASACTPSRASLMTGRYPTSIGLQHYVMVDGTPGRLPLLSTFLPKALNHLGYHSHMVGKWHLGFSRLRYLPTSQGFRSHFGFWNGESDFFDHTSMIGVTLENTIDNNQTFVPFLSGKSLRDNYRRVSDRQGVYLTDIFTEEAIKIIQEHQIDKPLFLYLAHHGVHRGSFLTPVRAPAKYVDRFQNIQDETRRNFAGALTAVDESLGDVMRALLDKGMLNDTLVVFSSDNGAPGPNSYFFSGGSNYPLRGSKLSGWEGATRAVCFLWSSQLDHRRGTLYQGLAHVSDWLPTLYHAAGGNCRNLGSLDGKNLWPAILSNGNSPRKEILLNSDPIWNLTSYRNCRHKIVSGSVPIEQSNGHYGANGRTKGTNFTPESKVSSVLREFWGSPGKASSPVIVDCGKIRNDSAQHYCNPIVEPCLFDLLLDPCEYRNIAKEEPEILKFLLKRVEILKRNVVFPRYTKVDLKSNPDNFKGFWSTWEDTIKI